jgi:hypothetical protein
MAPGPGDFFLKNSTFVMRRSDILGGDAVRTDPTVAVEDGGCDAAKPTELLGRKPGAFPVILQDACSDGLWFEVVSMTAADCFRDAGAELPSAYESGTIAAIAAARTCLDAAPGLKSISCPVTEDM